MSDFGYTGDGIPVQWTVDYSWSYWQDTRGNPYNRDEVTPAKVARPGQVVVDAADLRDLVRAVQNKAIGIPGTAAWQRLYDSALAAADVQDSRTDTETEHAESAPDSGQGETVRDWTGAMIDGAREAGKSAGETFADFAERIRVRDAETDDTPAAEPQRVTLPDTPLTDEQVDNAVKTYDDLRERGAIRRHAMRRALETVTPSAEPPKRGCERDLHISNGGAGCGCGKIPPKADRDNLSDKLSGSTPVDSGVQPADTDAPHGPTLAVIVAALRLYFDITDVSTPVSQNDMRTLAEFIEDGHATTVRYKREAGGDGHA